MTIAGAAAQNRDPIRVATRLVQVHVVVHDRDGRAVPDLTLQDFRLMEDGQEQPIALFEVEGRLTATNGARPSTPPGWFSNRVDVSGGSSTASVILIDRLNTSTIDQLAVRNQALTFWPKFAPAITSASTFSTIPIRSTCCTTSRPMPTR